MSLASPIDLGGQKVTKLDPVTLEHSNGCKYGPVAKRLNVDPMITLDFSFPDGEPL